MGHRLKLRAWTYGEKQEALRRATRWVRDPSDPRGRVPDVDPWMLNDLMLLSCIVEWDLEDGEGRSLPITLEALHGISPPELVEEMIARVQRLNGVTSEERKK